MPNRPVHALISTPAGTAYSLHKSNNQRSLVTAIESAGGAFGGDIGGILPDRIDPPLHPGHLVSAQPDAGSNGRCLLVSRFRRLAESSAASCRSTCVWPSHVHRFGVYHFACTRGVGPSLALRFSGWLRRRIYHSRGSRLCHASLLAVCVLRENYANVH